MTARPAELLPDRPFVIPPEVAERVARDCSLSTEDLLLSLVPVAQRSVRAPISNYRVGVAGLGASGTIYLGVNLEFPGHALNQAVHGEQFVVARALAHGETGLQALAVSSIPCGHCRQFLHELEDASDLRILVAGQAALHLGELLPRFFGPNDLGNQAALLRSPPWALAGEPASALESAALRAARRAYAPYSRCPAGVALETEEGIFSGSYIENAAFNPSLSPLQAALSGLVAGGLGYDAIRRACLVEARTSAGPSQEDSTRTLLRLVAPEAELMARRAQLEG